MKITVQYDSLQFFSIILISAESVCFQKRIKVAIIHNYHHNFIESVKQSLIIICKAVLIQKTVVCRYELRLVFLLPENISDMVCRNNPFDLRKSLQFSFQPVFLVQSTGNINIERKVKLILIQLYKSLIKKVYGKEHDDRYSHRKYNYRSL